MPITENTNNTTTVSQTDTKSSERLRIISLVVGDALVFLIFSVIGRLSHGERVDPAAFPQVVATAAPFAIGWFIVAPYVGAYRRDVTTQPRQMALRTAFAWLLSLPVGLTLRGIFVDHDIPPISFAIVTFVFVMLVLQLWRCPYALMQKLKQS
jgi:Protein of unknown function (DUF3054)